MSADEKDLLKTIEQLRNRLLVLDTIATYRLYRLERDHGKPKEYKIACGLKDTKDKSAANFNEFLEYIKPRGGHGGKQAMESREAREAMESLDTLTPNLEWIGQHYLGEDPEYSYSDLRRLYTGIPKREVAQKGRKSSRIAGEIYNGITDIVEGLLVDEGVKKESAFEKDHDMLISVVGRSKSLRYDANESELLDYLKALENDDGSKKYDNLPTIRKVTSDGYYYTMLNKYKVDAKYESLVWDDVNTFKKETPMMHKEHEATFEYLTKSIHRLPT
ncbi:uncharacterized protein DNG_07987 [Cephalotrichum gorgonifer]|uniref:Uncharacterized protein n=1 Tax=Cephalotrichum gorgonifer TaxID=2041049 RepID=A0AAE8N2W6_9PEZI|nr:uncharacterized protein DNG_07987 [Cephalotrichum gorgonifer]